MLLLLIGSALCLAARLSNGDGSRNLPSHKELALVKARFTTHISSSTVELDLAEDYAKSLRRPQCNWSDINYKDKSRGAWKTREHMVRAEYMANALPLAENNSLASSVACSLGYWLLNDFKNPNW